VTEYCQASIYYENPEVPVAVLDLPYSEDILDVIFRGMNRNSGLEFDCMLAPIRSMMPGDLVIIQMDNGHETGWQCEPTGWSQLEKVEV
jgi:hypothetical protein